MTFVLMGLYAGWNEEEDQTLPEAADTRQAHVAGNPVMEAKQTDSQTVKPIPPCGFCLEDGTKVSLTLGRELSSGKESTGNRVDFEVSEDIKVNDVAVISKGSLAFGTITEAQGRRRMGRAGRLNVRIEEVRLVDGSRAELRASRKTRDRDGRN